MSIMKRIKDGFMEGAETISEKSVELSIEAKLKWELHRIQKSFEKEMLFLLPQYQIKLRLVRILGRDNKDLGTLIILMGGDVDMMGRIKESIVKKL